MAEGESAGKKITLSVNPTLPPTVHLQIPGDDDITLVKNSTMSAVQTHVGDLEGLRKELLADCEDLKKLLEDFKAGKTQEAKQPEQDEAGGEARVSTVSARNIKTLDEWKGERRSRNSQNSDKLDLDDMKVSVRLSTDEAAADVLGEAIDETLEDVYSLQPSVYDAMAVVFTPVSGCASSLFLIMVLSITVFVQLYYCFIVYFAFVIEEGEFTPRRVAGYRTWRINVAHDVANMDSLSQVSLASRVCDERAHASLEFSTAQADAVQDITKWVTGFNGLGMTAVSVFCWLIFVSDELRSTLAFARAIKTLPTDGTRMTISTVAIRIDSLAWRRQAILYFTIALRLIVGGCLTVIGSYFLIYTRTVGDLILNAVALEMVQHMDKLMFKTLAPTRVKKCLALLRPLPLWPREDEEDQVGIPLTRVKKPACGIGPGALITVLFAVGTLAVFFPAIVGQNNARIDALQEICPYDGAEAFDDRRVEADNFIYGLDKTGMFLWAVTPTFEEAEVDAAQEHRKQTVQDIIDMRKLGTTCVGDEVEGACVAENRRVPMIADSLSSLSTNMAIVAEMKLVHFHRDNLNFASADSTFQGCHDVARADGKHTTLVNTSRLRPWILGALTNVLGKDITDCEQVVDVCQEDSIKGLRARMWCPGTCGCTDPGSANVVSMENGCPAQCALHPEYKAKIDAAPCEDVKPGSQLWPQYQALITSIRLLGDQHGSLYRATSYQIAGMMEKVGCPFAVGFGICAVDYEAGPKRNIKNQRYFCPVSCGCAAGKGAFDCPSQCAGTEVPMPYTKRLMYMPGLPAATNSLPLSMR